MASRVAGTPALADLFRRRTIDGLRGQVIRGKNLGSTVEAENPGYDRLGYTAFDPENPLSQLESAGGVQRGTRNLTVQTLLDQLGGPGIENVAATGGFDQAAENMRLQKELSSRQLTERGLVGSGVERLVGRGLQRQYAGEVLGAVAGGQTAEEARRQRIIAQLQGVIEQDIRGISEAGGAYQSGLQTKAEQDLGNTENSLRNAAAYKQFVELGLIAAAGAAGGAGGGGLSGAVGGATTANSLLNGGSGGSFGAGEIPQSVYSGSPANTSGAYNPSRYSSVGGQGLDASMIDSVLANRLALLGRG